MIIAHEKKHEQRREEKYTIKDLPELGGQFK